MKDHPKPTPEQIEAAEEFLEQAKVVLAQTREPGFGKEMRDLASLLARREAQAEKRGAEKVVDAAERGLEECKHFYEACTCELEAARKALEDLTPKE